MEDDDVAPPPPPTPILAAPFVVVLVLVLVIVAALVGYRAGTSAAPTTILPAPPAPPVTLKAQPVDVGFAEDMNDHHDQAVQIALLAVDRAQTQAVRSMALKIATDQRRENGLLLQFLHDRGVTFVDPQRQVMTWMNEPLPHDKMPGLATRDQIVALTNAEGGDVDRLFVELMIAHHEGGVHMAQYAADHAETQDLRDLAARTIVAQQGELNDLRQLQSGF